MIVVVDVRFVEVFLLCVLVGRVGVLDLRMVVEMLMHRDQVLHGVRLGTVGVMGDVGVSMTVKEVLMLVQDEALEESRLCLQAGGCRRFGHCAPSAWGYGTRGARAK